VAQFILVELCQLCDVTSQKKVLNYYFSLVPTQIPQAILYQRFRTTFKLRLVIRHEVFSKNISTVN